MNWYGCWLAFNWTKSLENQETFDKEKGSFEKDKTTKKTTDKCFSVVASDLFGFSYIVKHKMK